MKENTQLKVVDVLERKHFESAVVIAGKEGLHRQVKWVHVVEVTNIRKLLNGGELILSTGVAWKANDDLFVSIFRQFIENKAAGLCIEIGTYMTEIPEEVIRLADYHHFPIIIFQKEVPFVEITQDIHSTIINQQYQMISDLENYSQNLNKRLLSTESYVDILQFISTYLGVQIMFKFKNCDFEFIPEVNRISQKRMIDQIENSNMECNVHVAVSPIHLFGKEYAELMIYSEEVPISEFDLLILDRTTTALAQHLLRDLYVEEKKRVEEFEWIYGWLTGEQPLDTISEYLYEHGIKPKTNEAVVLITKLLSLREKANQDLTYLKIYFRSIFEQNGFAVFSVEKRNEMIFVLLNTRTKKTMKERIKHSIELIMASDFLKKQSPSKVFFAAGKLVDQLHDVHKSYQTAKETLRIQHEISKEKIYHFYEDLHLFRLISQMSKHMDLQELVKEYLHPVIQHDQKYNGKLLETLKVYLECNGSKQETANKLFIVRQTLYHRLQKLENLLGNDFMDHEKRIAIELMLLISDYLTPYQQKNSALR